MNVCICVTVQWLSVCGGGGSVGCVWGGGGHEVGEEGRERQGG